MTILVGKSGAACGRALFGALALACSSMMFGSSAAASVVFADGFETPDLGAGSTYSLLPEARVPGWKTTDRAIELWANGFNGVTSYEGTQHAEINAYNAGTLYHEIGGVAAGDLLLLNYAHRARKGTDVMRVLLTDLGIDGIHGTLDDSVLIDREVSATTAEWTFHDGAANGAVTALGGDMRLSFTAVSTGSGSGSVGNFLDAVSLEVAPVPLPAGAVLLLTGLGGLVLQRRATQRRRVA